MREIYPAIEPYKRLFVDVSDNHTVHVECCGNPQGKPVLYVHGGPGGGVEPVHRQLFNPEKYHIILVDQRGCGQSTPMAELQNNTTQHLINDFELIREQCAISQWMVVGGSWGSTLSLAYAQSHPHAVTELILRGIFLGRQAEIDWLYRYGASELFPDAWDKFIDGAKLHELFNDHDFKAGKIDLVDIFHDLLTSSDKNIQLAAARAWSIWEGAISRLHYDPEFVSHYGEDEFSLIFAGIENHYFRNKLFLEPNQLLGDCDKIKHIPTYIIQGRYDVVCPMRSAWDLHKALTDSELYVVADAGHSVKETGILSKHVEITDRLAESYVASSSVLS